MVQPIIENPVGNPSFLKWMNRSQVLALFRFHKGLSRKQLTELTQLDGKTITNVTHNLFELGMIKSTGKVLGGAGRPRETLELNPAYGLTLGFDIGASHIAGISMDFTGTILSREFADIQYGTDPQTILKLIELMGKRLTAKNKKNKMPLLGAGVCVPGTVDREAGTGVWAVNLAHWNNIPLRQPLEKVFHCPVLIEESTRSAALGEMFSRMHENLRDFLLLDLSQGIGMALVQGGKLYYGHYGKSGEIGHTTVNPGGFLCRCGKRGCLETEVSSHAIVRKFLERSPKGRCNSRLKKLKRSRLTIHASDVADGALQGDSLCASIFSEAAQMLGIAAANAVLLFDPSRLILMGGLTQAGDLLLRPFRNALCNELIPAFLDHLTVEISPLGADGGPVGAASLVIHRIDAMPGNT